jgi:hypothetical protein
MVKHRRTRTRKSQKGGEWYNPFKTEDPYAPKKTWGQWWSETTGSAENTLTNARNSISSVTTGAMDSANNFIKSDVNLTGSQPPMQQQTFGGSRRRRRGRTMKGGKGGLGLTYYATPVSGINMVKPDSWQYYANGTNQYSVKGGSRRRTRRNRKH